MKVCPKLSDPLDPGVLELRLQGGHKNYRRNVNKLKIYEENARRSFNCSIMRSHKKSEVVLLTT